MLIFNFIIWDVSPEIIAIGDLSLRWYGLLFALALYLGQLVLIKIFHLENKPQKDLDRLTIYILAGTIIGARLGHCLFYEPEYFLRHPFEIIKIWEGGLASHGAAIGILLSSYLFIRNNPAYSYLWLLDRLAIIVALGGSFIRIGNLMNSEIIGKATKAPWAFVFTSIDAIPRHPSQLYEALTCFILFVFLTLLYYLHKKDTPAGSLFGIFMISVFTLRFLFEFTKENQVSFENELPINMGQLLSIPMVLIGIIILLNSYKAIKVKFINEL